MRIEARYSHLNGEEYLIVHRKQLWEELEELQAVIAGVDAWSCRTKVSKERTTRRTADHRRADRAGVT